MATFSNQNGHVIILLPLERSFTTSKVNVIVYLYSLYYHVNIMIDIIIHIYCGSNETDNVLAQFVNCVLLLDAISFV